MSCKCQRHLLSSSLLDEVLEEHEGDEATSQLRNNVEEEVFEGEGVVNVHHERNSWVEVTTRDGTTEEDGSS